MAGSGLARPLGAQEARPHDPGGAGAPAPDSLRWRMPPMRTSMPMIPAVARLRPGAQPFLPGRGVDRASIPPARPTEVVALADGDTLDLRAGLVRRTIRDRAFTMYAYNGQVPGPLLRVPRGATITVRFRNAIEWPTTVHWHGVRIDNRFDGVPGVTQEPVAPGDSFVYRVRFPDAGIYWYHPHVREDVQQDLGLYGNLLVDPPEENGYNPVNREEVLVLDDLLVDAQGLFPWGLESATHTLMGRFGNLLLVNGEPDWRLGVHRGDVVRFFLTNVSNTRTFNLSLEGARLKIVGSDVGRFEREEYVESVILAPAERYIVEARFDRSGPVPLLNRIQAIDHFRGIYYAHTDTLGVVVVSEETTPEDHGAEFERLRDHPEVVADIDRYRTEFDRPVDHELLLTMSPRKIPRTIAQIMLLDTLYYPPVEWNDLMPMMNFATDAENLRWILRDEATGRENMDIEWRFRQGDVVKIRLRNTTRAFHPMQHPMHFHGQRFLVLARDGVPNENLVWKDTVLVPVGSTVDILLELSNPGDWMAHCHIAEHLEAGMHMTFHVDPAPGPAGS